MTTVIWIRTTACLAAALGAGTLPMLLQTGPGSHKAGGAGRHTVAAAPQAGRPAHLECTVLMRARLTGANLRGAALAGACLNAAHLADAHLDQANLAGADLASACLVGADLRGANLASACLKGANLDGAVLAGAVYDHQTEWPAGFDPVRRGARRIN